MIEDERLLEQVLILGNHLRDKYNEMQKKFPIIEEVKGIGLLNSIRFSENIRPKVLEILDKKIFEEGYIVSMKPIQKTLRTYILFVADKTMINSYISTLEKYLMDLSVYF